MGAIEVSDPSVALQQVGDIIGIRIICLFVSDIDEIASLIKTHFEIVLEENKITGKEISSFGYFSVHFVSKINSGYMGPRYDNIKNFPFEIQVRTISMDAWANISHYLDYKSEVEIPKELRRDFFALSGLFYVADTHFEMFFKNKKDQSKNARHDVETKKNIEINYETVEALINQRFPKRAKADPKTISDLTQELIYMGYKSINEIVEKIDQLFKTFSENKMSSQFNRVGMLRFALRKADPEYDRYSIDRANGMSKKKLTPPNSRKDT